MILLFTGRLNIYLFRDMICRGKVLLHLAEFILLDRCEVRMLKPVLRCYVCKVEVVQLLLDEGFGIRNQTAVTVMSEMADKAGITKGHHEANTDGVDDTDESIEETVTGGPLAKTAELGEFTCLVYMSECYSPTHFYLNLVNEAENLQTLEEEMQAWVDSESRAYSINIEKDDFVIVTMDDAIYQRGQVTNVKTCNESNRFGDLIIQKTYTVFMLDIGSSEVVNGGNLFSCPEEFITKIPFQAIRCKLGQVSPTSGSWSTESGDRLFEMTRTVDDHPGVLECTSLTTDNGVSTVQLRSGVNLAEDLVIQGHGVWEDVSSIESVSRTAEDFELMEAPNGVDLDVLDIEKLRDLTKHDMAAYLDENLNVDLSTKSMFAKTDGTGQKAFEKDSLTEATVPLPNTIFSQDDLDIPSLAVVDIEGVETKLPNIIWKQSREDLTIQMKVFSAMELNPNQVDFLVFYNEILNLIYRFMLKFAKIVSKLKLSK